MIPMTMSHKRNTSIGKRAPVGSPSELPGPQRIKILVGQQQHDFSVDRRLLAATSYYFKALIDNHSRFDFVDGQAFLVIALPEACPLMFELFVDWLLDENLLAELIENADATNQDECHDLLQDLVELHLFAARIEVPLLQDLSMDAIQDLHLRCNWDITPGLIAYIYTECDRSESCRLRKWIVAMTAWNVGGMNKTIDFAALKNLFEMCPDLWEEYNIHLRKTSRNRLKVQLKNPQLRLPSNNLRNDERQFGFRQCSFHTHRSTVEQSTCPHTFTKAASHWYSAWDSSDDCMSDSSSDSPRGWSPIVDFN
ncbi:hypothetical protein MN608_03903 [Microdochium nivale]|nr:hypothetical protein MN608_03903 [Microdochium nivale]